MSRLTTSTARDAKATAKTYDLPDDRVRGLCLRITPSACKTWTLRYRRRDGTPRRLGLGRFPAVGVEEARNLARQAQGRVAAGEDPQGDRQTQRDAATLKDLCAWYLDVYIVTTGKVKQSVATDRSYIRCHLPPDGALARKQIAAVTRQDIEELKLSMRKTPGAFRKVLAILKVMFRRAEEIGARPVGSSPCTGVKAARPRSIERYLKGDERAVLEEAFVAVLAIGPKLLGHVSPGAVDALRFLSITGMRAGEVVDILRWGHVDWQHQVLTLPRSKTGAKKVQLSDEALQFLRERYDGQPAQQRVFRGEKGGRISIGRSWRVIRQRAGLADVRLHDLRHAFASDSIMAGVPLAHVGRLLGHRQLSTTERYAHISDDSLRDAANVTAQRIKGKTDGR